MNRSSTHAALVLAVRPYGESNREAVFLTEDAGLVRATVFGGPKSKLRAYVAPFHSGEMFIYHDPVKNYRKITDFAVDAWRPGLRESLERSYAAAAIAETVIAGFGGGGSWPEAMALCRDTLDALDGADETGCRSSVVRFLWKWTELLGAAPDLECCIDCACFPPPDEVVWYSRSDGGIVCGRCAPRRDRAGSVELGPGARAWLRAVTGADAKTALRIGAASLPLRQAKEAALAAAAEAVGTRLKTWNLLGGN